MPRRRSNLPNARSIGARCQLNTRNNLTQAQTEQINEENRTRVAQRRTQESEKHRSERLQQNVFRRRSARQNNIDEIRSQKQQRQQTSRALARASFNRLAFEYAPDIEY